MKIVANRKGLAATSQMRSGVPSLLAAIAFAGLSTTGNANPTIVDSDKQAAELPRVSISAADKLGLKRWRDLDTGKEVRRARAVNPFRAGLVIRKDTGKRTNNSVKRGQSDKRNSYIVEGRTSRWQSYPLAKAPAPYIRFDKAGGEAGRVKLLRLGRIVEYRSKVRGGRQDLDAFLFLNPTTRFGFNRAARRRII
jgi:hypothetical protein